MKKIWIINQYANTVDMPGHTRQNDLAVFFTKKGVKVKVFASDFNLSLRKYLKNKKKFFFKSEIEEQINWIWLSVVKYKKNNFKRYINIISFGSNLFIHLILRLIFQRNEKPDVLLYSSPQLLAAFFGLIIAKIFRIIFVFEVRDLWPRVLVETGHLDSKSFVFQILSIMERLLYKHSDCVVVLSKGCIKYIKSHGAKNVFFFPNGPDLNQFKFVPLPIETKGFSKDRPFKIIYAGSHGKVNGLENIIKASYLLEELFINFCFIGDGPEKDKIKKLAFGLDNVFFDEPIPKKDMPAYLSTADAIIVPLVKLNLFKYSVSPNKLFDAYAIGRPVITTIPGIINEEVEKYKLGVTAPPDDPIILANVIRKLYYKSRFERETISRSARKIAEKFYSREEIAKNYLITLNKISIG